MGFNKIKNRFKSAKDYIFNNAETKCLPTRLCIESTNYCNLKCRTCPNSKMDRKKGYVDIELFKNLIDQVKPYIELIDLSYMGDPLLHSGIADMIKYCKINNIKIGIETNGILLTESKSRELIKAGINYICISLDEIDKENYILSKGYDKLDTVKKNIFNLLKLKNEYKKEFPLVKIQMVVTCDNFKRIRSFSRYWGSFTRIKSPFNFAGFLNDRYCMREKNVKPGKCILLWRDFNVLWNGLAVPCCMDYNGSVILGDTRKEKIIDIWNNNNYIEYRKNENNLCCNCSGFDINPFYTLIIALFDQLTLKKVLTLYENTKFKFIKL